MQPAADISLEYSPSGRAGCKSTKCGKAKIGNGELRVASSVDHGDRVYTQYYHFACASRAMLVKLAGGEGITSTRGWDRLTAEDKVRVEQALSGLAPARVPPAPVGPNLNALPVTPKAIKGNKRPHEDAGSPSQTASTSHAGPSQSTPSTSQPQATQGEEVEEEEVPDDVTVLYATLPTQVVGIQYYRGLVGPGEAVHLKREPTNPYDANAIRVDNSAGVQIGHIPAVIAVRLSPLLDKTWIQLEGQMVHGNLTGGNPYKLNITLSIYAPEESRGQLEPLLSFANLVGQGRSASQPGSSQTGVAGTGSPRKSKATKVAAPALLPGETPAEAQQRQADLKVILEGLERSKDKRGGDVLESLTTATKDVLSLPFHPNPPGIATGELLVNLLPYQIQGLQWMIEQESPKLPTKESDPASQFIKFVSRGSGKDPIYLNEASMSPSAVRPVLGAGGLLADAMGLGKTLQIISLIIATKETKSSGLSKGTLIVAPVSVISNWTKQIEDHVSEGTLSFHVYHGAGRNITAEALAEYDIVITAYPTVASEVPGESKVGAKRVKQSSVLRDIKWARIVLDEGHLIKNPKSKVSQGCCALNAFSRWVVTGTPIVNSIQDFSAILSFLRVFHPLDDTAWFKTLLTRPLSQNDPHAINLLKTVVSSTCLRRTKEMKDENGRPLVALPKIEFFVTKVELDAEDRATYENVRDETGRQITAYFQRGGARAGDNAPTFANVLSLLTRMRQLALHSELVPTGYLDDLRTQSGGGTEPQAAVTVELMAKLQLALKTAVDDLEECPVCFDVMKDPRILPCGHSYCKDCIEAVIDVSPPGQCPMDRRAIDKSQLIEAQAAQDYFEEGVVPVATGLKSSAKIKALLEILKYLDADSKSLVFSQFTKLLDLIEPHLVEAGIPYVRFDGSMTVKKRDEVVRRFSEPIEPDADVAGKGKGKSSTGGTNPRVLLISLKAGALGLNLTSANQVMLMDPWWQASIEMQAIDRVYRIGQNKDVRVFQFIAANTVEEKVLEIQKRKNLLISQSFSGTTGASMGEREKKEARLEEIRELFA